MQNGMEWRGFVELGGGVWGGAGDNTPHVWEVAEPGVGPLSKRGSSGSALSHPNICTIYEIGRQDRQAHPPRGFLNGVIPKHLTAGKPVETDVLPGLAIEIADGLDAVRSEGTASGALMRGGR
jgi:hypothetical protein